MGFPNVDKILVAMFKSKFQALKLSPAYTIDDLFEDLELTERTEITTYLSNKHFVTDVRDRNDDSVYILNTFPMIDVPFPQICVTLGQEDTDRYLGDNDGESTEVHDTNGVLIGWDIEKGYLAKSSWNITIVTATKDEAIWLSRLCQRFIFEEMEYLDRKGILQVDLSVADIKFEQDQAPMTVFNRSIRLSATTGNTWKKRVLAHTLETGINTALTNTPLL